MNAGELNGNLSFLNYFYGIRVNENDVKNFRNFSKAEKFRKRGMGPSKTSKLLGVPKRRIEHWFYDNSQPIVARLQNYYSALGNPGKEKKWLSISATRGGILTGPWIKVPIKANEFKDIKLAIDQIKPLKETYKRAAEFGIDKNNFEKLRYKLFYYLTGLIVGDGAISRGTGTKRITRRITLGMSKRHQTNERIGRFVVLCSNSIGLRMHRTKDGKPSRKNRHHFFRWHSQCSPLVEWISEICFGLKESQNTTYFPIKAEWILKSPEELRIAFLQGIADSDGYVDIGVSQVGLITKSNIELLEKLLDSINVHHTRKYLHYQSLPTAMVSTKDAYELPIFNPHIKSYRWLLVKKIVEAERLSYKLPAKLGNEVTEFLKNGASSIDIVKMLLNKYNILVREGSVQKRIGTLKKREATST